MIKKQLNFSKCHVMSCIAMHIVMLMLCLASESGGAGLNEHMYSRRERMFY